MYRAETLLALPGTDHVHFYRHDAAPWAAADDDDDDDAADDDDAITYELTDSIAFTEHGLVFYGEVRRGGAAATTVVVKWTHSQDEYDNALLVQREFHARRTCPFFVHTFELVAIQATPGRVYRVALVEAMCALMPEDDRDDARALEFLRDADEHALYVIVQEFGTLGDLVFFARDIGAHINDVAVQMLYSLEAMRRAHFQHRDLSAANAVFRSAPQRTVLALGGRETAAYVVASGAPALMWIDFGTSASALPGLDQDAPVSLVTGVRGTVLYRAPELFFPALTAEGRAAPVTAAAELWSACMVLVDALITRAHLLQTDDAEPVPRLVQLGVFRDCLRGLDADAREALAVLERLMAARPGDEARICVRGARPVHIGPLYAVLRVVLETTALRAYYGSSERELMIAVFVMWELFSLFGVPRTFAAGAWHPAVRRVLLEHEATLRADFDTDRGWFDANMARLLPAPLDPAVLVLLRRALQWAPGERAAPMQLLRDALATLELHVAPLARHEAPHYALDNAGGGSDDWTRLVVRHAWKLPSGKRARARHVCQVPHADPCRHDESISEVAV